MQKIIEKHRKLFAKSYKLFVEPLIFSKAFKLFALFTAESFSCRLLFEGS